MTTIPFRIRQYLDEHHAPWRSRKHRVVFEAQKLAQVIRVPGARVAKNVVVEVEVEVDGEPWILVLSAADHVDLSRLREPDRGGETAPPW